jgi:hypothetical protein
VVLVWSFGLGVAICIAVPERTRRDWTDWLDQKPDRNAPNDTHPDRMDGQVGTVNPLVESSSLSPGAGPPNIIPRRWARCYRISNRTSPH